MWAAVELALRSIHSSVVPEHLGHRAVELVGPMILGPAGWALIKQPGIGSSWAGSRVSTAVAPASAVGVP